MEQRTLAVAGLLAAGLAILPAAQARQAELSCAPVHQIRIYEVPAENETVFHARFRDHAARIMAAHDFDIVETWASRFEGRVEFVYLLRWPDTETMQARWADFMADEEWSAIKAETGARHGTFVTGIEDRTLCPADGSPGGIAEPD
ncbi:NIPSNAP family protein [Maricaulis sp.]|uniref:NIPSNAP family protein n=1 Tax=Maricaulis sp. TaxID=1486257 RepID=UPI001B0B6421|nr:NIPSNAP family protein [Maricaulis sp.]MBO6764873.1 NIPSNAP family protein [Maricaulis sp.]